MYGNHIIFFLLFAVIPDKPQHLMYGNKYIVIHYTANDGINLNI